MLLQLFIHLMDLGTCLWVAHKTKYEAFSFLATNTFFVVSFLWAA